MSRTPKMRSRLERRAEREAREPGVAPRARRERREPKQVGGGGGGISTTMLAAIAGGLFIIAILVYAVIQTGNTGDGIPSWRTAELDDDPNLPGLYVPPHLGADGVLTPVGQAGDDRAHFAPGVVVPFCTEEQLAEEVYNDPLCYQSNPPTSGPHSSSPQGFANLENPAPKENIIHSMEHGGVFIWYNTTDQEAIDLVKGVVSENRDRLRFVGSTIYTEMEEETIAITAWTRIDKFPVSELTEERLQDFINEHHKRFNPEGF